jgi:hypothetical protein
VVVASRKKPKTLSGIETTLVAYTTPEEIQAGKNLKPYQGLKLLQLFKVSLA